MITKKIIHECPSCNTKLVTKINSDSIIVDSEISDFSISTVNKNTLKDIIKEASAKRDITISCKNQYLNIQYGKIFIIQYSPFFNKDDEGNVLIKNLQLVNKKINKFTSIEDVIKNAKVSYCTFEPDSLSDIIKLCNGQNKKTHIKIDSNKMAIISNNKKHYLIDNPELITKLAIPYLKKLYGEKELLGFIINKGVYIFDSERRTVIKI